ncbi:oxidoreductase [Gracilibacillus halophilus YIM-C55.5]|uniref:Oxidoreductase n=1 Tax=Gracilibacillus halophilus YIM-C55.5 TaxID=1308866 RepID=N4WU07_9BACI|nr:Gfo/Idh/MocA family oxidoreductase [Gracilibacillus halophilus]ENH97845.1 oxidoreductase [Gracilibacillus halophilus YIM-C55.5]
MIKVAIIGTGAICPAHVKGYLQFPHRCKIVALCDIYPEKAEKMKQEFQLDARVYHNYQDVVKEEQIDLISVCTPPYTHANITIASLDEGKHVLVEKPMAASLEECDAMLEAADRNHRLLSVVAQNRFTTPMMRLKHILDQDVIGKIVHTQVDSYWWRGYSYYDLWWRGTWEKEGGGCTLNHAVHHIDLFQWMNGFPDAITAVTSNVSHDNAEVEDISIAIATYQDGALAQLTSSVVHHGEEQQMIFQGEKARISVPWKVVASNAKENGFPEPDQKRMEQLNQIYEQYPPLQVEGHAGQINDVLHAIESQGKVLVDGEQGRQTLELITAIYQSANTGESVRLPLDKKARFYTRDGILQHVKPFYKKGKSVDNFSDQSITISGSEK